MGVTHGHAVDPVHAPEAADILRVTRESANRTVVGASLNCECQEYRDTHDNLIANSRLVSDIVSKDQLDCGLQRAGEVHRVNYVATIKLRQTVD